MATLKEEAKNYVPKQTKNISELPLVSTDVELLDGEGKDKDGEVFKYKYIEINDEEYRIPYSVIGQLKDILVEKPTLKTFKVKRTGEGKVGTRYTLIPLD